MRLLLVYKKHNTTKWLNCEIQQRIALDTSFSSNDIAIELIKSMIFFSQFAYTHSPIQVSFRCVSNATERKFAFWRFSLFQIRPVCDKVFLFICFALSTYRRNYICIRECIHTSYTLYHSGNKKTRNDDLYWQSFINKELLIIININKVCSLKIGHSQFIGRIPIQLFESWFLENWNYSLQCSPFVIEMGWHKYGLLSVFTDKRMSCSIFEEILFISFENLY